MPGRTPRCSWPTVGSSPALLKLEQAGWIASKWAVSESGRRVKVYALTRAGRRQLRAEEAAWEHATGIVARFFRISEGS